ncbi:hypothetical protein [Catenulispora subtropica]|uniref:Uncharacterized protein n=1 Tax=Catenulispora subtropica TaxID=450798 RepID=A0ABP5DRJ7_9ACTN
MSVEALEELPDGPVTGPDGVAVRLGVTKTTAVGPPLDVGPDDFVAGEASLGALLLVKTMRLFQVHVLRVKPWTVTVMSAAPDSKVVYLRHPTEEEARRAALEIVRSVQTHGVAGF